MKTRIEHDLLGEAEVPADALYGIHTVRAIRNFPLALRPVQPALIHAFGFVKQACAEMNHEIKPWPDDVFAALMAACKEMQAGQLDSEVAVDALQGGAGTSTNMNVNEVLANRALCLMGRKPGEYDVIHPLDDVNRHQSTNDTYPTALRLAAILELRRLEKALTVLLEAFQAREKDFAHVVKIGRTELQDAVLTTMGKTMSAFAEAFGRDRWRVYKCEERLRVVNLGGTAIGTGLGAPRKYIFGVVDKLRAITGTGLARAENLVEATQNQDALVEVSGILTACAANLMKVSNDLRLMSSGPDAGLGELELPARQAGSSIMPGKVNPVIPEAAVQCALKVMANHQAVTLACAMGNLELNAFLPLVADSLLESIGLLERAAGMLAEHCVRDMKVREDRCRAHVDSSTAAVTALVDVIGYEAAQEAAAEAVKTGRTIASVVASKGLLTEDQYRELTSPENVMRLGSREK
ncbi:MAG: aspartate ammonia-lyase [Kiritimatiellia bacterium]